jgi:hypothetical protein
MFNVFNVFRKKRYLVTVEFTKHKQPVIRSKKHKGNKINNQYSQIILEMNNPDTLLDDVEKLVKETYKDASNFLITDIIKLD